VDKVLKLMRRILKQAQTLFRRSLGIEADFARVRRSLDEMKLMLAAQAFSHQPAIPKSLRDVEFQVFSQFGDDGIIQYLVRTLDIEPEVFVEFGVQDYLESNTRFLLMSKNWRGLVIDSSEEDVEFIRRDQIYWRHDLTAVHSFVTREDINALFTKYGFTGEIGILSIDIDGNDYHVWEAISVIKPALVIVEYNSVLGAKYAVTVPYDPGFNRMSAHYSGLYFGASLKALVILGNKKGYAFIGCNSAGNNAYFVRREKLTANVREVAVSEGYVESRFREATDEAGNLIFTSGRDRLKTIQDMPVLDVDHNNVCKIRDLFQ